MDAREGGHDKLFVDPGKGPRLSAYIRYCSAGAGPDGTVNNNNVNLLLVVTGEDVDTS
jgi:hypothetical protein